MAYQSNIYTIGTSRTYLATKPIKAKDHMAVWIKPFGTILVPDPAYTQLTTTQYDLINNSAVVKESVVLTQYELIEVRVGDTPDDLTQSQSDIAIVAAIANDIVDVAFIAQEVVIVAGIADTIVEVVTEPLKTAIINAETNATNAQLSAWEAEAKKLTADSYATEAEDVFVKVYTSDGDGTFTATDTTEYSALHWAIKSGDSASVSHGFRDETELFRNEAEAFSELLDPNKIVYKDSPTGSAIIPTGTTLERPISPMNGYMRYNTDLVAFEGFSNGSWSSLGGGATGGGTDHVFNLNGQTINSDYTIPVGQNAMTAGDVTIASGITVTISSGSKWAIV